MTFLYTFVLLFIASIIVITDPYIDFGTYMALLTNSTLDTIKPTQEMIDSAFSKHHLQEFIISIDRLKICDLLGAGEICLLQHISMSFMHYFSLFAILRQKFKYLYFDPAIL